MCTAWKTEVVPSQKRCLLGSFLLRWCIGWLCNIDSQQRSVPGRPERTLAQQRVHKALSQARVPLRLRGGQRGAQQREGVVAELHVRHALSGVHLRRQRTHDTIGTAWLLAGPAIHFISPNSAPVNTKRHQTTCIMHDADDTHYHSHLTNALDTDVRNPKRSKHPHAHALDVDPDVLPDNRTP